VLGSSVALFMFGKPFALPYIGSNIKLWIGKMHMMNPISFAH